MTTLAAWPFHPSSGEIRQWQSGTHTATGEIVACEDGNITIRKTDGSRAKVPLHLLSADDQSFVRNWRNSRQLERFRGRMPQPRYYPSQTAVAGLEWRGSTPLGYPAGSWSLLEGPGSLGVEPNTGAASWRNPSEGFHPVRFLLKAEGHTIPVFWYLRVVKNDIPDVRIYSTRYLDYIVPRKYAEWMDANKVGAVVDRVWERLHDLYGVAPHDGKQAVKYAPEMGGGAHSGNPAMLGPGWWKDDPIAAWRAPTHITIHEVGHNFHGRTNIGPIISGKNPLLDRYFHHGMEITEVAALTRIAADPREYGLPAASAITFAAQLQRERESGLKRANPFREWIDARREPAQFQGDTYGVGETICYELCARFGPQLLERTMSLFGVHGLDKTVYESASNEVKRQTLLWAMFSHVAGTDLSDYFRKWGFSCDDAYFRALQPALAAAEASFPAILDGWIFCPESGRFYKATPWAMPIDEAKVMAESIVGRLAPVRSMKENLWLAQHFANHGPLWIGVTDEGKESTWRHFSGEPCSFENWWRREPSGGSTENYAVIQWGGSGPQWVDVSGNPKTRAVGLIELDMPAGK